MGNKDATVEKIEELTEAEHLKKVKDAIKTQYGSSRRTLVDSIALGIALLRARKGLTDKFYTVISNDVIHRRQNLRFQKLVIEVDCYQHLKNNPSDEDIEKLREDKNVTGIKSPKDIEKMVAPSMKKLINMKQKLTDKEFKDCLNGKNEKYEEIFLSENVDTEKENKAAAKKAIKEERLKNLQTQLKSVCGDTMTETLIDLSREGLLDHIVTVTKEKREKEADIVSLKAEIEDLKADVEDLQRKSRHYIPESMKQPLEQSEPIAETAN